MDRRIFVIFRHWSIQFHMVLNLHLLAKRKQINILSKCVSFFALKRRLGKAKAGKNSFWPGQIEQIATWQKLITKCWNRGKCTVRFKIELDSFNTLLQWVSLFATKRLLSEAKTGKNSFGRWQIEQIATWQKLINYIFWDRGKCTVGFKINSNVFCIIFYATK